MKPHKLIRRFKNTLLGVFENALSYARQHERTGIVGIYPARGKLRKLGVSKLIEVMYSGHRELIPIRLTDDNPIALRLGHLPQYRVWNGRDIIDITIGHLQTEWQVCERVTNAITYRKRARIRSMQLENCNKKGRYKNRSPLLEKVH